MAHAVLLRNRLGHCFLFWWCFISATTLGTLMPWVAEASLLPPNSVTRFSVGLDDGSEVLVDSISHYPQSTIATMVIAADRSTVTGCPFSMRRKGLISAGDRVFVSDYYIAWFDYTNSDGVATPGGWTQTGFSRGGSLTGLWSLNPSAAGPTGVYFQNVAGFTNSSYFICFNWPRNELQPGSYSPSDKMNWWDKYAPPHENTIAVAYAGSATNVHLLSVHTAQANSASDFKLVQDGVQESDGVHYETSSFLVDQSASGGYVTTFQGTTGDVGQIQSTATYVASQSGISFYWNFSPSVGASVVNLYSSLWLSYGDLADSSPYATDSTTCSNSSPQPIHDTLPTPSSTAYSTVNNGFPFDIPNTSSFNSAQQLTYQSAVSNLNTVLSLATDCGTQKTTTAPTICPAGTSASFDWPAVISSTTTAPCTGIGNIDLQAFNYYPNAEPSDAAGFGPNGPGFDPNYTRALQLGDWMSYSEANGGPTWVVTNLRAPFTGTQAMGIGFPWDRVTLSYEHSDIDTNINFVRGPYTGSPTEYFMLQAGVWYSVAYSITQAVPTLTLPAPSAPSLSTSTIVTAGISRNCNLASLAKAYPPTANYQLEYIYCLMLKRLPDSGGTSTYLGKMAEGVLTWQAMLDVSFSSTEFNNDFSVSSLNNTQFVTLLYNLLLSRAPDSGGLNTYVSALNAGTYSRQQVFDIFTSGTEFLNDSPILAIN